MKRAFKARQYLSGFILVFIFPILVLSATFYNNGKLVEKSALCLDCHEDQSFSLVNSPHRIISDKEMKSNLVSGCIGCHDGWEQHIEDPSEENIKLPDKLMPSDQAKICSRCHQSAHQVSMTTNDPHVRAQTGCLSCHKVHNNPNHMLVRDDRDNYCVVCHVSVEMEFKRRSAHPLESGNIRCTDCHDIAGIDDPLLAAGLNFDCQECHAEKSGPFIYEHPVVNNHTVDGRGCVACHEPHGSPNDRLLNQPGNLVCLQCHAVPVGHRLQHSALGAKLACIECHNQVHGSFDGSKFLDPDLGLKLFPDCFQSGCHSLND